MTVKLLTPRMGEGVEEVTVLKWLKNEGDPVKELEPVVEVETDKVVTEIPSPADGTLLKILVQADSPSRVGDTLALIGQPGEKTEQAESPEPKQAQPVSKEVPVTTFIKEEGAAPSGEEPWVSPLVRKMAAENQLNLAQIQGSGAGGRITRQDVLDFLAKRTAEPPSVPPGRVETIQPVSSVRRQIAERMVQSMQTAPHVLTVMEADLSRVLAHQALNQPGFAVQGIRLTLTAYFIQAIASALRDHPLVNASWTDAGIELHSQINIGMAVSLGAEGLIVPVIQNADALSLVGIARAVNDLADRARAHRLQPDEVKGGTFTLTNHGTGGSLFAAPIINQPQVGILGTGSLQKRPVVVTDSSGADAIAIRPMIYLSFVFDHRILDGAAADSFLARIKKNLETV